MPRSKKCPSATTANACSLLPAAWPRSSTIRAVRPSAPDERTLRSCGCVIRLPGAASRSVHPLPSEARPAIVAARVLPMKAPLFVAATFALLLAGFTMDAQAARGDVYVPAHRTRDGSFVPANVPPSSGGTRAAHTLSRSRGGVWTARSVRSGIVAPIFVAAKAIRR